MPQRHVWSLGEAREALQRLIGEAEDWTTLDGYLLRYMVEPDMRPTVLASALSATLEMAREGRLVLRQDEPFAPVWVRRRGDAPLGAEG
jgi:segregation and condensation protein A